MLGRVLILSASAGSGHVRAAQALEQAILQTGAAREVRHVDVLDHSNALFRRMYARSYLHAVDHAPMALGWLYRYLDKPWQHERRRLIVNRLNTGPLVRLIMDFRPDVTICTHFLPSEIVAHLKLRKQLASRLAVVVTDLDVHAFWLCRSFDHYYVARDETRVHLQALGLPGERVSVTGIPIDPVFATTQDPLEMRRRLGLDPSRKVILLSTGGMGVASTEQVFEALLELRHPVQLVVICGRNARLKARLQAIAAARPSASAVHIIGYTTQMDAYMAAADLLVGKPGGLTTSEALSKGLAMCIVNPIPGQEERNSDHLLEEGVAIRGNNLPALAFKIDRLLEDDDRLEGMRAAALRLARPEAALQIVRSLAALPPTGAAPRAQAEVPRPPGRLRARFQSVGGARR
jgi:processive 1,2-diacylglycerol beta-glucosyltransferase